MSNKVITPDYMVVVSCMEHWALYQGPEEFGLLIGGI